ncbi:predicted protein [Botrytis cinerea T4]|uniref:Uncharacterized protein n=1 Tax=Botryotinia fuckeliana (strain T4) TaxID=999810 RepID=G2YD67_BOTF4|nr:predicted protein [Botrytis cinerea T4]
MAMGLAVEYQTVEGGLCKRIYSQADRVNISLIEAGPAFLATDYRHVDNMRAILEQELRGSLKLDKSFLKATALPNLYHRNNLLRSRDLSLDSRLHLCSEAVILSTLHRCPDDMPSFQYERAYSATTVCQRSVLLRDPSHFEPDIPDNIAKLFQHYGFRGSTKAPQTQGRGIDRRMQSRRVASTQREQDAGSYRTVLVTMGES